MKKFKVFAAALAICAVSVTAGGCSDDNKIGKWFDQVLCAHEWDDGEVVKEATCASKGEIMYTCESCEKTKTEKTDKLPHTEVEIELEATCAKEGLTDGVKCAVCEEVLQQPKVVAKIPHFEVPNSEAVAATCTTAGLKPGTHCARCDEVITAETVIPALGHSEVPDSEAVAATCTTAGLKPGTHCARCDEVITAETVIPALGHSDNNSDGLCDVCNNFIYEPIGNNVILDYGFYRIYLNEVMALSIDTIIGGKYIPLELYIPPKGTSFTGDQLSESWFSNSGISEVTQTNIIVYVYEDYIEFSYQEGTFSGVYEDEQISGTLSNVDVLEAGNYIYKIDKLTKDLIIN